MRIFIQHKTLVADILNYDTFVILLGYLFSLKDSYYSVIGVWVFGSVWSAHTLLYRAYCCAIELLPVSRYFK